LAPIEEPVEPPKAPFTANYPEFFLAEPVEPPKAPPTIQSADIFGGIFAKDPEFCFHISRKDAKNCKKNRFIPS